MTRGTHESVEDERNENVLVYINGDLVPRADAKVSVLDSGFMLGDGIWESFRLHKGKLAFLNQHLCRLHESAKAVDIDLGMSDQQIEEAIYQTTTRDKNRIQLQKDLVLAHQSGVENLLVFTEDYRITGDSLQEMMFFHVDAGKLASVLDHMREGHSV